MPPKASAPAYEVVSSYGEAGLDGFEGSFDGGEDPAATRAEMDRLSAALADAVGRAFPGLADIRAWSHGWSFGVDLPGSPSVERVRCNLHASDRLGTEAVAPQIIVRDVARHIDFRFFFQLRDPASTERMLAAIRQAFSLD